MLQYTTIADMPILCRQLTGLSLEGFDKLLPAFTEAERLEQERRDQQRSVPRKRQSGGGRRPRLRTSADRLLFILVYFKLYPLQDVQAFLFGMSQAQAWEWIHRLTPLLSHALGAEQQLPAREPAPLTRVLRKCLDLEFIIDATERLMLGSVRQPVSDGKEVAGDAHQDAERRRADATTRTERRTVCAARAPSSDWRTR
jgi:hypothetical protein